MSTGSSLGAACLAALSLVCAPAALSAQGVTGAAAGGPTTIIGPPPPLPPAMVNRDAEGRVTMRAVRLDKPLVLDGRLDEEVYRTVPGVSDFVQQEPYAGQPATEKTEVWVFFDDQNLYFVG
ncbi:MAG: hypothetical protein AB7N65_19100, partial [Vicinamibacterales bacterium]